MARDDRRMTFIVVPHHGTSDLTTRTYELRYRTLRILTIGGMTLGVALLVMMGSWFFLAAQATRAHMLQRDVRRLEGEVAQVQQLRQRLVEMEARYAQITNLLRGVPRPDSAAARPAADDSAQSDDEEGARADSSTALAPSAWPLATRGFVTRGQGGRVDRTHPGMDIAVAEGTRIVAAGPGTVTEAGRDSVYGLFVRITHRNGYETLYGHASRVLVSARQSVAPRQTIALSGSTGVSTAPHLHFEIRKNGVPVDPGSLVRRPE
ncbi:MAG TPA: peptidoglycan DD-metalloendopeptidase family protein [Longimicrobium sp.]|jgi:murein DD-endopeptidase MepM/ murein hydrolase activator NlpD